MNRTLKEATVKRYYYQTHEHLKAHMQTFLMAYNFAKRLKTLKGLTPYEYVCQVWTTQPERFHIDPTVPEAEAFVGMLKWKDRLPAPCIIGGAVKIEDNDPK